MGATRGWILGGRGRAARCQVEGGATPEAVERPEAARYRRPVSPYRVEVVVAPRALLRAQDGMDLSASGAAFLAALEPVLRRELPELAGGVLALASDVARDKHSVRVEGPDPAVVTRIDREVRDLIWVVREMVPFAVR